MVSNTRAYKCYGNAWTVDVIAHIFEEMKKMKEYVLWVETNDKEFNITFIRDKNMTMDEMFIKINNFIIDNHHTAEFVIKGVFKL